MARRAGVYQFARHELFHVGSASAGISQKIPNSALRHARARRIRGSAGTIFDRAIGNDFLGLLDELHLGPVHFCGLSMGGMIGMWLGIHAPSRLKKLVLSNTGAKIGTTKYGSRALKPYKRAE